MSTNPNTGIQLTLFFHDNHIERELCFAYKIEYDLLTMAQGGEDLLIPLRNLKKWKAQRVQLQSLPEETPPALAPAAQEVPKSNVVEVPKSWVEEEQALHNPDTKEGFPGPWHNPHTKK